MKAFVRRKIDRGEELTLLMVDNFCSHYVYSLYYEKKNLHSVLYNLSVLFRLIIALHYTINILCWAAKKT